MARRTQLTFSTARLAAKPSTGQGHEAAEVRSVAGLQQVEGICKTVASQQQTQFGDGEREIGQKSDHLHRHVGTLQARDRADTHKMQA